MNTIKFLPNQKIKLNSTKYKPYLVGNLPPSFGFKYNEHTDKDGIHKWFNYKGLTYVEDREDFFNLLK